MGKIIGDNYGCTKMLPKRRTFVHPNVTQKNIKMKLVRDKIIDIIKSSGKEPIYHICQENELGYWLSKKLEEEVSEFISDPSIEELADILEVLESIKKYYNFEEDSISKQRLLKKRQNGGFQNGIILNNLK